MWRHFKGGGGFLFRKNEKLMLIYPTRKIDLAQSSVTIRHLTDVFWQKHRKNYSQLARR